MLGSNDKAKYDRSELVKRVEEQYNLIVDYEKKLKGLIWFRKGFLNILDGLLPLNIVRAYRGLNAEKNAFQEIVEALTLQQGNKGSDERNETSEISADSKEKLSKEDQIKILKKSLAVLITEKNKRESAFQCDKKVLLSENETLKARLDKAAAETEMQAEKLENRVLELRSKIKRIEGDREKELADHGSVLAAIQQQYIKECGNSERLQKQVMELHGTVLEKEELLKHLEAEISSMKEEIIRLQNYAELCKKKAEKAPAIQMLESELQDVKESSKTEIAELRKKLMEALSTERDTRLYVLEQRLQEMTTEMGAFDRIRADLEYKINQLEGKIKLLENENILLKASESMKETEKSDNFERTLQNFKKSAQKLRSSKHPINFYELLGLEETSHEQKRRYDMLKDEYEKYKLKAESLLRSRSMSNDVLVNTNLSSALSVATLNECPSCIAAEADLRHLRSVIASLHDRLQSLEIDYANMKNNYEEKTTLLNREISEMEKSQDSLIFELRNQMHQKVAEVELEMQKQRTRTLDILAEKENELEITKAILTAVRDQQNVRGREQNNQNISLQLTKNLETESHESLQDNVSSNERQAGASPTVIQSALVFSGTLNLCETHNLFYEQQLARKEKDILELRNAIRMAELNVRDIQQASLTKDLQHFEMVEKLKDEIRILEGKLQFLTADANMEYLRNIFVQLIHSDSSSSRKHILRAIGAVLKLSSSEMRVIEKYS
ncbi:unnamed protein product [Thelazia callipaeda]|uniref:GRIP domain-containing protein n=1 Tax=Thelazia callipaeda TaxID=103827 RepID=A0A0N5CMB8_THECL|nr:unnamed protein product [Thelazia callipaeda]